MPRYVELRRHTENDGDALSSEGIRAALDIGRSLRGGYRVMVSTGAQRATQTLACFLAGMGATVPQGVIVETGLRSDREDEWRAAYGEAGGGELSAFRSVSPGLVEEESKLLGTALRHLFELLPDGGRALVVGHSPTNEAAVLGLTGEEIPPMSKGDGVLVVEDDGFRVEALQ